MSLKIIRSFSSSFLILFPVLVTARDFIGIPSEIKGKSMQVRYQNINVLGGQLSKIHIIFFFCALSAYL